MIRIAFVIALLAGLLTAATAASAQDATPAPAGSGLGSPTTIYNNILEPIAEVTVLDLVDPFEDYDLISSQPARGYRWVMVTVRIEAGKPENDTNRYGKFRMVDSNGFITNPSTPARSQESVEAFPYLVLSDIQPGGESTGAVFFQVFNDTDPAIIEYTTLSWGWVKVADLRDSPVKPGDVVPFISTSGSTLAELSVSGLFDPFEDYDPRTPPNRDFRYIGIALSFTNTTSRPVFLDTTAFRVITGQGIGARGRGIYRTPASMEEFPFLPYGDVAPGVTVTGLITMDLMIGAKVQEIFYEPARDRRIRIAEYEPDADYVPPRPGDLPSSTPRATPDAACDAVETWNSAADAELGDTTPVFELIDQASNGEDVEPQDLRDGADTLRTAAEAIADLDTPAEAQAASDQIAGLLNDVADLVDELGDQVEAQDSAGITSTVAAIYSLVLESTGGAFGELAARCPALDD